MKLNMLIAAAALAILPACRCCDENKSEMDNPVIENIMARRSIRKYQDRPVEREKLQLLAECGVNAPNGMNAQNWEVRIVDSEAIIDSTTAAFKRARPDIIEKDPDFKNMFRNAKAVICLATLPGRYTPYDCGMMAENIMLAAKSIGLGTCCMAGPIDFLKNNTPEFMASLDLSEGYELQLVIAVGYPDEEPEARPRDLGKIKFVD